MKSVAIVLGTYNRLPCLQRAITSIRAAVGAHPYRIVVCDGGSTDGTQLYLENCRDTVLLRGGLDGAVKAFNEGFFWAVREGFDYVMHLNDDAEIISSGFGPTSFLRSPPIAAAIEVMELEPKIGEVAFQMDLRGRWGFEKINGAPYANFGVIRREAGIAVAKEQGDLAGWRWWNPIYRTYGADCEFGCNLWKLGWYVYPETTLFVHDVNHQDALRATNTGNNKNGDSDLFWSRWRDVDLLQYVPPHIKLQLELTEPKTDQPRPPTPHHRPRRVRSPNPEYKK